MLYFPFKNYEEFKELFGIEKRANGVAVRKNKILLGHIKNKELLHKSVKCNNYSLLNIKDLIQLQKVVFDSIIRDGYIYSELIYKVELMDWTFYSANYRTDDAHGVCIDGDTNSVRYINVERGKVFKMKAAKFMRAIMLETPTGKILSPSVVNWLCGDVFTQMWSSYSSSHVNDLTLNVDDDFCKIYSSDYLVGNFHSCMVDEGFEDFYTNSVSAKAAYLTNIDGEIEARAVIFTNVKDEDGKVWRLCERQYCTDENEFLKRLLVDKLIKGGYIDGYKTIGASCHDTRAFVSVDGSSLCHKKFWIDCYIGEDDNVSYQDSFQWYDINRNVAYNYEVDRDTVELDITSGRIEGTEWDNWNEWYCNETRECFYNGVSYNVDVNEMDSFVYVTSLDEYHHENDVFCCDYCGQYELLENSFYSEITGESYCCEDCYRKR